MAYVNTVRDYFMLEKTVNTSSYEYTQTVESDDSLVVWHRLLLGTNYWKNQLNWTVDFTNGSDENLGSTDKPLLSLNELHRRLIGGGGRLRFNYVVNLKPSITEYTSDYAIDVELDGGSLTFVSALSESLSVTSLGTISALSGSVNYTSGTAPRIFFVGTGSVNHDYLISRSGNSYTNLGWAMAGETGSINTTAFASGTVGHTLISASPTTIITSHITARGRGSLIFSGVAITADYPNYAPLNINGDQSAQILFSQCSLESPFLEISGGRVAVNRSRLYSTSGSLSITNGAKVSMIESGMVTANRKQINIRDSRLEMGSSVIWNSLPKVRSSQVIMSIANYSGSALMSSTLDVQSNSQVDVRNLIASQTNGIAWPVVVTGQNVSVFFDDSSQPKANNVSVNNGVIQNLTWAGMPYQDTVRATLIASGVIQSTLNPRDESL